MKISTLIGQLEEIKEEYGDVFVVGNDDYEFDEACIQKYIITDIPTNPDVRKIQTEDLEDNYLEEMYFYKDEFKQHYKGVKGFCAKIY